MLPTCGELVERKIERESERAVGKWVEVFSSCWKSGVLRATGNRLPLTLSAACKPSIGGDVAELRTAV